VGGILVSFEFSLAGRADRQEMLEAAYRLEEAESVEPDASKHLPFSQPGVAGLQPAPHRQTPATTHDQWCGRNPADLQQHTNGQWPSYGQQSSDGQQPSYAQPPAYCQPAQYTQPPMYGQLPMHGHLQAHGSQTSMAFEQQQQRVGGPTLLQQQPQSQQGGMGSGAKMAMAAAGGLVIGAGGAYLAQNLDDVSDDFD